MNNIAASRDTESVVNCFAVHRTDRRIAVRCTKQFASMLKERCENHAEGFAGVGFLEVGNGWYELCSRDTLHFRPEVEVDEVTAQLFLEYAFIELTEMVSGLDTGPIVFQAPVVQGTLREVRELRVAGDLSSNRPAPRLHAHKLQALTQRFGR